VIEEQISRRQYVSIATWARRRREHALEAAVRQVLLEIESRHDNLPVVQDKESDDLSGEPRAA
jgi:hypothetical protein